MSVSTVDHQDWVIHLYRGFVQTSTMWRQRMDVTSNWAVPLLIAMATFALGDPRLPHLLFLGLGLALVVTAAVIEARRYKLLHHAVWRTRLVETGQLVPLLTNDEQDATWKAVLAADLRRPHATLGMWHSFLARLRGTYVALLYLLVAAWIAKVMLHPSMTTATTEVFRRLSVGSWSGVWVAGLVAAVVLGATILAARAPSAEQLESEALGASGSKPGMGKDARPAHAVRTETHLEGAKQGGA